MKNSSSSSSGSRGHCVAERSGGKERERGSRSARQLADLALFPLLSLPVRVPARVLRSYGKGHRNYHKYLQPNAEGDEQLAYFRSNHRT